MRKTSQNKRSTTNQLPGYSPPAPAPRPPEVDHSRSLDSVLRTPQGTVLKSPYQSGVDSLSPRASRLIHRTQSEPQSCDMERRLSQNRHQRPPSSLELEMGVDPELVARAWLPLSHTSAADWLDAEQTTRMVAAPAGGVRTVQDRPATTRETRKSAVWQRLDVIQATPDAGGKLWHCLTWSHLLQARRAQSLRDPLMATMSPQMAPQTPRSPKPARKVPQRKMSTMSSTGKAIFAPVSPPKESDNLIRASQWEPDRCLPPQAATSLFVKLRCTARQARALTRRTSQNALKNAFH